MEGRNQRPESSWKPGAGGLCATRSNGGKIHGRRRLAREPGSREAAARQAERRGNFPPPSPRSPTAALLPRCGFEAESDRCTRRDGMWTDSRIPSPNVTPAPWAWHPAPEGPCSGQTQGTQCCLCPNGAPFPDTWGLAGKRRILPLLLQLSFWERKRKCYFLQAKLSQFSTFPL